MGSHDPRGAAPGEGEEPPPRLVPERPLPPYRYLPGRGRHPLRHPEGHLRGRAQEVDATPLDTGWRYNRDHLQAIDLWNRGYLWEAHEAWEGLWKLAPRESPEARALQGLIQAAAALLKDRLGQGAAAERLAGAAHARIAAALREAPGEPALLGIDLADLLLRLAAHRAGAAGYPFIRLED